MRKPVFRVPTRYQSNWVVQPQKMARGMKFQIKEVEEMYNVRRVNKGTDQLRGLLIYQHLFFFAYAKSRLFHDVAHLKKKDKEAKDIVLSKEQTP